MPADIVLPVLRERLILGLGVLALWLVGCGGASGSEESEAPETFTGVAPADPGPIHVHGLGVNPGDGALFIATHTGLYRTSEGSTKAERVGAGYQDTMGFTVVGADHFLGSGHPDARDLQEGTPPLLGLIESRDAGKTWKPISLLGEADFHVLRFYRDRVYGYDATNERLLVSRDGGKTWKGRTTPGQLIDLAAAPGVAGRLLAAAGSGLFTSEDDGRSWRRLGLAPGLLAWPAARTLYLVDAAGAVFASRDQGASWTPVGEIGGEPAAFVAESERELYAALHDGTVKLSSDGGTTWRVRSTP